MYHLLWFADVPPDAVLVVGGKGLSLARTSQAGLPVPAGFVITTEAYRRSRTGISFSMHSELVQAIEQAYVQLGSGIVAVRSSATAEDAADASFAGQQETFLGVQGPQELMKAIEGCWQSLFTERALAYRKQQGIAEDAAAMAVVVQQLVPADVAGVMFTTDPNDATGHSLAIESAWGLGEVVVSGRVSPDRFRLNKESGAVIERHAGNKPIRISANGEEAVPEDLQQAFSLNDNQLSLLADLSRKIEEHFGAPRDVEWAITNRTVHLLQARPITTASAGERAAVRQEVMAHTRTLAANTETAWVKFNLSEVLPTPTPMTWAIMNRFLAQDGGFGAMNRSIGAQPDESLGSLSAFDLIAGRPMMNLARAPRMQFRRPPMEYPIAAYQADPRLALDPKPVLNPLRGGVLGGLLRLPGIVFRLWQMTSTTRNLAYTFAEQFTKQIVPPFVADAKTALQEDWRTLEPDALQTRLNTWIQRTLIDFAKDSLKPTVLADLAWNTLFEMLKPKLGEARAQTAVAELTLGAHPPADADIARGIREFATGTLNEEQFRANFGHRCRNEMELAQPRWAEDAEAIQKLKRSTHSPVTESASPWERIAEEAKFTGVQRTAFGEWAERLRIYLGLREAAKHYLLLGYAVIRKALVELDTRFQLNGGIFYLLPDELAELKPGSALQERIAARKKRRQLELQLELPTVLFSNDLEAIGRAQPVPQGATSYEGIALSAGVAEAVALVLSEPIEPENDEPFVLVCPSTDPAWVPLFAKAKALVMETGGVLSHGAIVAREFGLPAVAGLPGIVQQLRTGQLVRVDGARGIVSVLLSEPKA